MSSSVQEVILTVLSREKLSRKMYNKFLKERRSDQDMGLYLMYSSYLAEDRRLRESLDMLCYAIKNYSNQLTIDKILPVISKIVDSLRQEAKEKDLGIKRDALSCPSCCGVLCEPLTVPCGHTYCKSCILKDLSTCLVCQARIPSQEEGPTIHINILISSIVQKWWPREVQGAVLRNKANHFFKERQFSKALELYTDAVKIAPNEHLLLSNRAHTFHALGRAEDALRDANEAVVRRPEWAKGHFRQARALAALGREEDALVALFVCASLECSRDLAGVLSEIARTFLSAVGRRTLRPHAERILKPACTGFQFAEEPRRGPSKENLEGERRCSMRKRRLSDSVGGGTQDTSSHEGTPFVGRVLQKFVTEMEQIKGRVGSWGRNVDPSSVQKTDFECPLCYHCLWEAVTTPCGHTFCRSCLDRCLDHAIHCPLCKTSLREYLAENRSNVTEFVEEALRRYLPAEYGERGRQHEQEMAEYAKAGKDLQHEIPIFVATLAIPSVACPLHVFEPRYRLMVRRVMEAGTREFGMCMPSDADENGYSNYGAMLEVREVRPLSDGRRIVNAVGSRRFRCIAKGVKDGYNTASVEYLRDHLVADGAGLEELRQLHDSVHLRARSWFESINAGTKRRILGHYGFMPPVENLYWTLADGPVWVWWLIAILPLEPATQMRLMRECSLHARLSLVSQILRCVLLHQSGGGGAAAPAESKRNP